MTDGAYERRLDTVTENAIRSAAQIYEPRIKDITSIIMKATDYAAAHDTLKNLQINKRFLEALSRHLIDTICTSDAIGRSLIVEKDRQLSIESARKPGRFTIGSIVVNGGMLNWYICSDDDPLRISFDLTPESVLKMIRERSFTIAGVEDAELLQAVKDALAKSERDGKSFKDFRTEVNQIFTAYGVTAPDYNHLQTVFRTNNYSAYSLAQLTQVGEMPDRFPLWRYFAIHDNRTRPYHLELDEKIFNIGDGPIPPIDFNCRCTAQYLHVTQITPGMEPEKWSGSPNVKLDIRSSFDQYLNDHRSSLTPGLKSWIKSKT